jgi:hypothetical protein
MGTLPSTVTGRAIDETTIGLYWAYDGASEIGMPPRLYNQIVRCVAKKAGNLSADNALLFAFVNVAMADAGILAWDQKYCHDFWRPVVGIREHDKSMGPGATMPPMKSVLALARSAGSKVASALLGGRVARKETLDADLLQRNVLRRSQRRHRREEPHHLVAGAELHR